MKSALSSLTCESERLKKSLDQESLPPTSTQVVGLKNTLATVRGITHTHTQMQKSSKSVEILSTFQFLVVFSTALRCCVVPHHLSGMTHWWAFYRNAGVMSAHLNKTMFNSGVSSGGCLLPSVSTYFLSLPKHGHCLADSFWDIRTCLLSTPTHFFFFKYPAGY